MVELWEENLDHLMIILVNPKGEEITNQTGGYACHHPSAIGYLVNTGIKYAADMVPDFMGTGWEIEPEKIQAILDDRGIPFKIDFKLPQEEAWLRGIWHEAEAILTYENSD